MKTLPVLLIFLSFLHGCVTATTSAGSPEGTLNVKSTNASENSMIESDVPTSNLVKIGKVEVSRAGDIVVEILNVSKKPIKLWKDSNSWGAASWRVLLLRKGQTETFFQNPDQMFTVNTPTFNEIAAGARLEHKLDLNGGNWCGMGHCARHDERGFGGKKLRFEPNDTVVVIYDVPATQEARDNGVWYGVIAATANVQ